MPKKILFLLVIVFQIGLFLFLRYYQINRSLFFFNDIGRDYLVLYNWHQTGKPPLLGPQNSALPFNQSALYFYLLYPAFLITNQSFLATLHTLTFVYLVAFLAGLYFLKNHPRLQVVTMICFFLISIHPQYIIQGRYVWNPSFATPFIISALLSFFLLLEKVTNRRLAVFCLSLATALSFTYSIAPFFVVLSILSLLLFRSKLKILFFLFLSLVLLNLPTIAFELKHRFVLTHNILNRGFSPQDQITLTDKLHNFSTYIIDLPQSQIILYLLLLAFLIPIFLSRSKLLRTTCLVFLSTLVLNLILPFTFQAHYIFAYTSLIFISIALIPRKFSFPILILLSFFYLSPSRLQQYFQPAPRTYQQMLGCFQQLCQDQQQPMFVAVQSSFHPYHNGPEHRYLLQKSGCQIVNLEDNPQSSNLLALVVDGGDYDPINTKFYELDLFGPSAIQASYPCLSNFKTLILQKR
jgi:hypothetical protein